MDATKETISVFLSTEINEIYSKTIVKELYFSPEELIQLKVILFTYKINILKYFKISIGQEIFITSENENINQIIENNNNDYLLEYNNDNDYYFTINLGIIPKNTKIEIEALYLSFTQNKDNKYIINLFKRYPMILFQDKDKNYKFILYQKIEGEIILKTQNKIESFNFDIINFNEDINNKENNEEINLLGNNKITINTLNKQYNTPKELYLKYQLNGIENIKEYKIYQFLNDFIPIIKLTYTTSSSFLRKIQNSNDNNNQKIILFNQKLNKEDNKNINILHHNYSFNKDKNNIINNENKNNFSVENIYPNKYIFVVDESIYMLGEKIAKIRGAIKLLLYSLNSNCEYQIIGFNESIHLYDGIFKYANKSNIQKSLEYLSNIYVDNKTCNLFPIIKLIYYICEKNKNIPINIFLFTNAICDKIEINKSLNIIYEYSLQKNFHLNIFALGEKYNKYFVVSGSIMGNGNYYLLNKLNQLNKTVISELSNCQKEYYSNINAEIHKFILLNQLEPEGISQINVSEDNFLNLFFISKNIEKSDKLHFKIYYKKYMKGKFLLQNKNFKNIELINLPYGDDLYLLYLNKIFYENNSLEKNLVKEEIRQENILDNKSKNYFTFLLFLKNYSKSHDINLNFPTNIFYRNKNIKGLVNKNYINSKILDKNNIDIYINQINENKDYFDIYPIKERNYLDFLLVDEIQDNSNFTESKSINNNGKKQRKKSYGKMMIGGIFKGVEKVGNSIVVLGKNIGHTIINKKSNKNLKNTIQNIKEPDIENNIKDIKSQNNNIKLSQINDVLEDDIIDTYKGNKYGYEKNDEFIMNTIFSQNFEGYWDYDNKKLFKIKEKYEEMNKVLDIYLNENNDKIKIVNANNETIKNNIKMTFIIIICLIKEYHNKLEELIFIIHKGINFIQRNGCDYYKIIKELGIIFE